MAKDIVVIGGGMVGVSCALQLLDKGYKVSLIDKNEVGNETSYGNAGVISTGSIFPLNNAGLKRALPKYAANRHPAVRLNYPYMLRSHRWATQFLAESTLQSTARRARALNALIAPSLSEHQVLMEEAGIAHRLRKTGWLKLYRHQASFDASQYERDIYEENGVVYEVLDKEQIRQLEPGLNPVFEKGVWLTKSASVDNPGEVVKAYASLFQTKGGKVIKDAVSGIFSEEGAYRVKACKQDYLADEVVVATGPWVNELLGPLGYSVPMVNERGYHQHYHHQSDIRVSRPVYDVDGSYVMTPTELGLRVCTGVELNDLEAQPDHTQLRQVREAAQNAVSLGASCHSNAWLGSRPSLPDALPVIDKVPGTAGVWLACGHQHIGFSTGPVTGKIIADLIHNNTTEFDITPFRANRFK